MDIILGVLLAFLIVGLFSGFVIWIVSKLGLGLEVTGFGGAFVAAIVIGIVSAVVHWVVGALFNMPGGWLGAIINIFVAAGILRVAGEYLDDLKVAGWAGALLAAVSIGIFSGIIVWLLSFV